MFQPGQSGNPSGRPKIDPAVREMARAHTEQAIAVLAEIMASDEAKPGERTTAAVALLDRAWGKPAQAIAGADGEGPAEMVIRWLTEQSKS